MFTNSRDSAESGTAGNPRNNILVAVRVRPLNHLELERGCQSVVHCPGPDTVLVKSGVRDRIFSFSSTFGLEVTQQEVFDGCSMQRLISLAMAGYACTVFAFGPTGSGKTFTMAGPVTLFDGRTQDTSLYGLMHRSVKGLLEEICRKEQEFRLSATYLEIHNEQVRDLLNTHISDSLPVRWNRDSGFYVENLRTVKFDSLEGIQAVLREGTRNRQTSAHYLNGVSSRSHCILTVEIGSGSVDPRNGSNSFSKRGKLRFVDLAGSERVKETGATEKMLMEATNINRSLLALGNCIVALVDLKRNNHIPYRDSKLTKLLAESLGGNGVCLMIACVSPSHLSLVETMNTLRFASRARRIRNRPAARMDSKDKLIKSLQQDTKLLRAENAFLWGQLQLLSPSAECPEHHMRLHQSTKNFPVTETREGRDLSPLPSSEENLYRMLQEFMMENESLREENKELLSRMKISQQEQQVTQQENRTLQCQLQELQRLILSSSYANTHSLTGFTWDAIERINDSKTPRLPSLPSGIRNHSRVATGQISEVFPDSNRCGLQQDLDQTLHHRNKSRAQNAHFMDQHQQLEDKTKLPPYNLRPGSYSSVVPSAPPLPVTPDLRSEVTILRSRSVTR
ncbi:kinesin-like protein KIF12 [Heterodontus francisci]|uniref:kinesin-like protein KIF12 n=1 Tax=Heterodontus francisci TaxID=7792 RepID=UPI00355B139E